MNEFLVYYAYYHNDVNGHEMSTLNYVSNTDVRIATVRAENYQEADETCHKDLNLENTGYIINVVKL